MTSIKKKKVQDTNMCDCVLEKQLRAGWQTSDSRHAFQVNIDWKCQRIKTSLTGIYPVLIRPSVQSAGALCCASAAEECHKGTVRQKRKVYEFERQFVPLCDPALITSLLKVSLGSAGVFCL